MASNLHKAKKEKNDEFYTQLPDIERELKNYKSHFKNKVVYCNCDDPMESNFFKYFVMYFNVLGLKKLITTSYEGTEQKVITITEVKDMNDDGGIDLDDVKIWLKKNPHASVKLIGDGKYKAGDFRSEQCMELLQIADIVVTNPPFSLFREFVATLMANKKKFLIVGNNNAITYKEIFPLIRENKIWLSYDSNKTWWFRVPDNYPLSGSLTKETKEGKFIGVPAISWFTNLSHSKRNDEIILVEKYKGNEDKYPKYDNYNAIEVSKVILIPKDYNGVMGVPITFLDKYNPEQFEIVKFRKGDDEKDLSVNRKSPYFRILIKRKKA